MKDVNKGLNASASGQFTIGGDLSVNRLGFGAMRLTGRGIWGEPEDRPEALRTLKRVPQLGINLIDTADSYGPEVSENLIHEALFPYSGLVVATKAGLTRQGPDLWADVGRPEYLRQQVLMSLRRLGTQRIDLWQLHRIDPKVPRDEQFDAIRQMRQEGLIRHAGLSEVTVEEIEAAQRFFPVVTVQNQYNLVTRQSEPVLDYCTANKIGFIPWFPLASGDLESPGSRLDRIAKQYAVSPGAIALAWLLKRSPVILPIPGTSRVQHLEENTAAVNVRLSEEEFALLDAVGRGQATARA
jgi:aryl-alcohol dehydrogenase-like predicted oxidoreductase